MKTLSLILLLATSVSLYSQSVQPKAVIKLLVVNQNDKPILRTISFVSKSNFNVFNCTSTKQGFAEINLPYNDTYYVSFTGYPNYDTIAIPKSEDYVLNYKIVFDQNAGPKGCDLYITVNNSQNMPLANQKVFISAKNSTDTLVQFTNANGVAHFLAKPNTTYQLAYPNAPDYEAITTPQNEYSEYHYQSTFNGSEYKLHPSSKKALLNFHYYNIDSTPLANEQVSIVSKDNKIKITGFTDSMGLCQFLLPINQMYVISTFPLKKCTTLNLKPTDLRLVIDFNHYYVSTSLFNANMAYKEEAARLRDSLYDAQMAENKRDAEINKALLEKRRLDENYFRLSDKSKTVKDRLQNKAIYTREKLKKEPKYFERTKRSILATFYRFNDKWSHKVIVFDFTCSMDPYIDELLLWMELNMVNSETKQYLFFNDGDYITTVEDKIMGKTGGFHKVFENNIEAIVDTLKATRKASPLCSIDVAENAVEALIEGQTMLKRGGELILVADNYAPVRDIELLDQVKYPVRVIVCGVDNWLNEHLLEIVYKTKGSLHTIETDLMNLSDAHNGSEITIQKHVYKVIDGRFIWMRQAIKI